MNSLLAGGIRDKLAGQGLELILKYKEAVRILLLREPENPSLLP